MGKMPPEAIAKETDLFVGVLPDAGEYGTPWFESESFMTALAYIEAGEDARQETIDSLDEILAGFTETELEKLGQAASLLAARVDQAIWQKNFDARA